MNLADRNRTALQRVFKNTSIGLLTNFSLRLLSPLLLVYAARTLSKIEYGQLTFALDYATVVLGLSVLGFGYGFNARMLRTGAISQEKVLWELPNALLIMGGMYLIGSGLALLGLNLLPTVIDNQILVAILLLYMALSNLSGPIDSTFRSLEIFELAAIRTIAQQLVLVSLGVAALWLGFGINGLAGAFMLAASVGFLIGTWMLNRRFQLAWESVQLRKWPGLWRDTFSLAVLYMFLDVYWRADSLLLGIIQDATAVAVYSASYRLIFLCSSVLNAFGLAIFPPLTRAAKEVADQGSSDKLSRMVNLVFPVTFGVGAMASIFLAALHEPLMEFLYTAKYADAAGILNLLAPVCVFLAGRGFCNATLVAMNQERYTVRIFPVVVTVNVIANLILIRLYSYWGAAAVAVGTELALFISYLTLLSYRMEDKSVLWLGLRATMAWGGGISAVWFGQFMVWSPISIFFSGTLVFALLLYLFQVFSNDSIQLLLESIFLKNMFLKDK
ncbi:MAG: oligosaccharide flippase family protein [Chloroflexota bacterium]